MSEATKKLFDLIAGVCAAIAALTANEIQAYLNIAVSLAALAWYASRFYDRYKNKPMSNDD